MADGQIEFLPWEGPYPLGRHIRHDVRSRAFAAPRGAEPTRDKRHRTYGAKIDQGNLGCCVPTTGAHAMNSVPLRATVAPAPTYKIDTVHNWYRAVTAIDPFPGAWEPDDTGSSGLALGQVLKDKGLISRYEWAFGFQHGLSVIPQQPLLQGTYWTDGMFYPDADGRVRPTGGDAGGHEYLWVGVELRSKLTRADNRSWFLNSWANWGLGQFFYMTWDDHEALLARDGDLVVLTPRA
jgi:hypothetical protein